MDFPVLLDLPDKSINSIDLKSISEIQDYRLELSEHEGDTKIGEDLDCQKGANQEGNSYINIVNGFGEEVMLVSQISNRSTYQNKITNRQARGKLSQATILRPCIDIRK